MNIEGPTSFQDPAPSGSAWSDESKSARKISAAQCAEGFGQDEAEWQLAAL